MAVRPSIIFLPINPELTALFDVAELYRRWMPSWNFETGKDVKPADLMTASLHDRNFALAYCADARAIAGQEVDPSLILSPGDSVVAMLGKLLFNDEADSFLDPDLGRPPTGFSAMFGLGLSWNAWGSGNFLGVFMCSFLLLQSWGGPRRSGGRRGRRQTGARTTLHGRGLGSAWIECQPRSP
jgi:hypothetical protein